MHGKQITGKSRTFGCKSVERWWFSCSESLGFSLIGVYFAPKASPRSDSDRRVSNFILKLNAACDHPSLILKEHKDDKFAILPAEEVEERGQIPVEPSCRICCRQPLPKENNFCIDCHDAVVSRSFSFKNKRTTKVTAILNLLDEIAKTKTSPTHCNDIKTESSKSLNKGKQPAEVTRDKVVIYSQFTSMLDLLEPYLGGKRFKYVRCKIPTTYCCWGLTVFNQMMAKWT